MTSKEVEKIRQRYLRRENISNDKRYSFFDKANLFICQERERKIIEIFKKNNFDDLSSKKILDIGCGTGGWLRNFIQWGAKPENLYGIDLLEKRIDFGRKINPNINFICGNAQEINFGSRSFDLVVVATCFTSILDMEMKRDIAREIMRVLKDDGIVLWYDFRYNNPWNPDVKGVDKKEIIELFGNCDYYFSPVTLAPPIVRAIVPVSRLICEVLVKIPFLRTHYLAVIKKEHLK